MAYKSENEVDKFRYDDSIITECKLKDDEIVLYVESLIVRADNSQNSNYTDSYAGDTVIRFKGGRITKALKEGYKYYDADDKLIEQHPDENLNIDELKWEEMLSRVFLIDIRKNSEGDYAFRIEMPQEDYSSMSDTYEITVSDCPVVITWDTYLNRVQA